MEYTTLRSRVSEGTFLTSFQEAIQTPDFKLSMQEDEQEPQQTPMKAKTKKSNTIEDNLQSVGNGYFHHQEKNCYFLKSKKDDPKAKHLVIPGNLYTYLKPYQRDGIAWLWRLHELGKQSGGILGDDMGLGKTIQTIAFILGLFRSRLITKVIIVANVSILENWKSHLSAWNTRYSVKQYYGRKRDGSLKDILEEGGFLITTYETLKNNIESLKQVDDGEGGKEDVIWDYVILDEGHKIKNHTTKVSQAVREIKSYHRLVITGTPIQNNLKEMWSLFDYASQGRLLGEYPVFKSEVEEVILRGTDKKATEVERRQAVATSEQLKLLIKPFFLRREKKDVLASSSSTSSSSSKEDSLENSERKEPGLPRKNDFIVWLPISKAQQKIYELYLTTDEVKNVLNKTNSPLAAITILKKLCNHPIMLSESERQLMGTDLAIEDSTRENKVQELIEKSSKFEFLMRILPNLYQEKHRVLLFSMSAKMLDLLELIIKTRHPSWKFVRIDGSVDEQSRHKKIEQFNKDSSIFLFLLTTKTGGVGLNLTGRSLSLFKSHLEAADRAVILDPAWNNIDDQAVDRIYRIGQTKNVVIYRFITSGTIEEKIYKKQIFKASLFKNIIDQDQSLRSYFTKQELRDLFTLDDTSFSSTQQLLEKLYVNKRISDPFLQNHLQFIYSLGIHGVSDHDLLFSDESESVVLDQDSLILAQEASAKLGRTQNSQDSQDIYLNKPPEVPSTTSEPRRIRKKQLIEDDENEKSTEELKELDQLLETDIKNDEFTEDQPPEADVQDFEETEIKKVCDVHRNEGMDVSCCSCNLTGEEMETYNHLVDVGREKYNESASKQSGRENLLQESLVNYLKALQICDEDPVLQTRVYHMLNSFSVCVV